MREEVTVRRRCEKKVAEVVNSSEDKYIQPFKDNMEIFIKRAQKEHKEQEDNLDSCQKRFQQVVIFFGVRPRPGDTEVTPPYFFSLWTAFCRDFKDIWKKEQNKHAKKKNKGITTHLDCTSGISTSRAKVKELNEARSLRVLQVLKDAPKSRPSRVTLPLRDASNSCLVRNRLDATKREKCCLSTAMLQGRVRLCGECARSDPSLHTPRPDKEEIFEIFLTPLPSPTLGHSFFPFPYPNQQTPTALIDCHLLGSSLSGQGLTWCHSHLCSCLLSTSGCYHKHRPLFANKQDISAMGTRAWNLSGRDNRAEKESVPSTAERNLSLLFDDRQCIGSFIPEETPSLPA
ncbi:riboflavin kinase [Branchiostoma belcheri]|nr:riboflavin kinase [Branchiostoma belcheri]